MSGPHQYRQTAERAIGRPLRSHEHVHHHSETQLVICDRAYHRWLHREMRRRGLRAPTLSFRPHAVQIRLDTDLWARIRSQAILRSRSAASVMDEALRQWLARPFAAQRSSCAPGEDRT